MLILGYSTDISEWGKLIDGLAQKYQVLAFDNRGAGRSDQPDVAYSIEGMAADTAALMKAAGFRKTDILGISMGGRVALSLALQNPDMVRKLVLTSTGCRAAGSFRFQILNAVSNFPVWKSKFPQRRFAKARQLEASRKFDCTAALNRIKAPAIILHGRKDKVAPYSIAEEMLSGITGSQMVTFNGGHLFFVLKLNEFLGEVFRFLDQQGE